MADTTVNPLDSEDEEAGPELQEEMVNDIYRLRGEFILIALTGRTGSGCTTVSNLLEQNIDAFRTNHREIHEGEYTNDNRKNRIVHRFIQKNWEPFYAIRASDVILYSVLSALDKHRKADINEFRKECNFSDGKRKVSGNREEVTPKIGCGYLDFSTENLKEKFKNLMQRVNQVNTHLQNVSKLEIQEINQCLDLLRIHIPAFRKDLLDKISAHQRNKYSHVAQRWGNMIRQYGEYIPDGITKPRMEGVGKRKAHANPAALAAQIDIFVDLVRRLRDKEREQKISEAESADETADSAKCEQGSETHEPQRLYARIVIDCLRNPYEILYFRERYSSFYLLSVSTTETIRHDKLYDRGYCKEEIEKLDQSEAAKGKFNESYQEIDLDKCIELADIHIAHDGSIATQNRALHTQLLTYISLILHPGLISPSPMERVMQIAYTAKLNSGCLSRQVGAAVTNSDYSVRAVGWNTVPAGQTACTMRCLTDLCADEDPNAYSDYERKEPFVSTAKGILQQFQSIEGAEDKLQGLPLCYCFKDVYTSHIRKERNQVHTRSVHAEESAFLQLAKYGTEGIQGGVLFTTASCCELCAKKAYQLGIKKIYYIDTYPGISASHIIGCGTQRPELELFHGAIGRAYINLYNPFLPLKDEIEYRTGLKIKSVKLSTSSSSPDINRVKKEQPAQAAPATDSEKKNSQKIRNTKASDDMLS